MRLAEMLCYADIKELSKIAQNYDCECSSHSKNELIQTILATLNRKEAFESHVDELDPGEIRFIHLFLFERKHAFSKEDLRARIRQTDRSPDQTKKDPDQVIQKLKQSGWLFQGFNQRTKYLLHIPEDMKRRFCNLMLHRFQQQIDVTPEPEMYREEPQFFTADVRAFLTYVSRNEVWITAEGFMYKRTLTQLLKQLSMEETLPKEVWRFGYGRRYKEYPNRFSLIYDYCFYQQYIEEREDQIKLTDKGIKQLENGNKHDISEIYRFWTRLYKGPIPNITVIVNWIERLSESWVSLSSLDSVLTPLIRPYYYDSSSSILQQRIIPMLMHLGFLRVGKHESGGHVIQMNAIGSHVIQGTYVAEENEIKIEPIETNDRNNRMFELPSTIDFSTSD